jgi:hypothetical protein
MRRTYIIGLDVLGTDQETNRALLIRVRNTAELARSQGSVASLAQALAPATVEAKVYSSMASELRKSLKDKNVDADVSVVEPKAWQPADGKHVWSDVGLGLGIAGVLALAWHFIGGHR